MKGMFVCPLGAWFRVFVFWARGKLRHLDILTTSEENEKCVRRYKVWFTSSTKLLSALSPKFHSWPQNHAGDPSSCSLALHVSRLALFERSYMECQILKPLILKSTPSADVAWTAMGAIRMFHARNATGRDSETRWKNNERSRDAGASEPRCRKHSRLLW